MPAVPFSDDERDRVPERNEAATSVTGFGFPFDLLLPSQVVGVILLLVLTVAVLARYTLHMAVLAYTA